MLLIGKTEKAVETVMNSSEICWCMTRNAVCNCTAAWPRIRAAAGGLRLVNAQPWGVMDEITLRVSTSTGHVLKVGRSRTRLGCDPSLAR